MNGLGKIGIASLNSARQAFPVRVCISVAEDGTVCDPNPRQGIKLGRTAQPRSRHVPQGQKLGRTAQARSRHVPQGQKPGRERMRCGVPGAPLGAGRGVSPRIACIGADMGAGFLRISAGYMKGRQSYAVLMGRTKKILKILCKQ